MYCTMLYVLTTQGAYRELDGWGGGTSIDCHCPIKLRKAWLFLDFKNYY